VICDAASIPPATSLSLLPFLFISAVASALLLIGTRGSGYINESASLSTFRDVAAAAAASSWDALDFFVCLQHPGLRLMYMNRNAARTKRATAKMIGRMILASGSFWSWGSGVSVTVVEGDEVDDEDGDETGDAVVVALARRVCGRNMLIVVLMMMKKSCD
jgi:hypothetical protein